MKRILYMYREIMPYNIPVLKKLVALGCEIKVVHRHANRKTSYTPPQIEGVSFFDESDFDSSDLIKLGEEFTPDLCFVCDWSVKKYNRCAAHIKEKHGIPVVVGCDTQWKGGRQWANVLTSVFRQQRYFSHMLVAGVRQFEYAKRLGFGNDQIKLNLLSADIDTFHESSKLRESYDQKTFLYVGRFSEVKGLKSLLSAWEELPEKDEWNLKMVGEGPLRKDFENIDSITVHPFVSQKELVKIASNCSCFILPSTFEPWALVIHEFTAAGMPIIATSECGATPHFIINNYNGFVIKPGSKKELMGAMNSIMHKEPDELASMGERSYELSQSINPEIAARSLLSTLNTNI